MAELGPEGLDDFQDRIDELGDYLFTTLLNSVEAAAQSANLGNLGKSLTAELSKGLKDVEVDKILTDKLLKDTKVQKVMTDVQKKFEDGVGKINFKINNIELPTKPLFVQVKADKFDTTGLTKPIQVPVAFDYDKLIIPKGEEVQVPVEFLYDKFQLPKANPINVAVKYAYDKFIQPKITELSVPVSYEYDNLQLPKNQSLNVGVSYDYTPFKLPVTSKDKSINVVVDYLYSKFSLPKAQPVNVPVSYVYDKFVTPKAQSLSIPVDYEYDKLVLPKEEITIPVNYEYDKLTLPKIKPVDVFVNYITNKLVAPKIDNIKVPVSYDYEKLSLPKGSKIVVPVEYAYNKFILPKTPGLDILVDYVYNKFELPKNQQLDVEVGYSYETLKLPKASINVPVEYVYDKFNLPTTKDISIPVKYLYDKFTLPKEQLQVPVNYLYSKLQLPKEKLTIPVSYQYDKFNLPKSAEVDIAVSYVYDKLVIPKPNNIKVGVNYIYDKFVEPIAKAIKVPVNYIYDKFTQPIADTLTIPTEYEYEDLELPAVEELKVPVRYAYDKFQIPKTPGVDVFVDYVYSKFQLPKVSKLLIPVEYEYAKLADQKEQTLTVQIKYKYDKLTTPAVKSIAIPVKYLYDKFQLPKVNDLKVNVQPVTTELDKITDVGLTAKVTEFDTNLIQQTIQSLDPISINTTTAPLSSFATLTTTVSDAGNAAASLVNLIDQANKKTAITVELYNKIKDAADQLVQAKKMEKDSADAIIKSLQSKLKLPTAKLSAKVTDVNTANIDKALSEYKPAQLSAVMNLETSNVDQLQNMAPAQVPVTVADASTITTAVKDAILDAVKDLSSAFDGIETNFGDALAKGFDKGKVKIKGATLLDTVTAEIKKYEKAQDDAAIKGKILALMADEKVSLERASLMVALETEKQKLSSLAIQQESLIAYLNESKAIAASAGNLEEVAKLQEEISQAQSNLSGYKNEIALLTTKASKLDGMIAAQDDLAAAAAEEHRIKEKISEIYEEHLHALHDIKAVSAQVKDVFKSKELALATLVGSAAVLGHRLTHSMHEFKDVGMDAATAVQATFDSLSVSSVMGMSKVAGVTKELVSQFGTLNVLTEEQRHLVGEMAYNHGLAEGEAANLVMAMSRMPGMTKESAANSEAMFKSIAKQKGVIPSQLMKEVAKNSNLMATYSRGGAEGFLRAAANAKRMGVELSTMLNAAKKTLDFESSINAELEASVLLGRSFNMDALRRATLAGDAEAIQREQLKLIEQAGGLENMNTLEKEKFGEMIGLQAEDMVKMTQEAAYQNEHFGEQAGILAQMVGYGAKYTEGLMNGFTTLGPLISGVAGLMQIMNVTSLPGIVTGVFNMVKGLAAGVFQAGLLLLKWIAMGAVKLWGMLTNLPSMISAASTAAKGFSFKGAVDGLKEMGSKLTNFVKQASSGKVKEAFSGMFGSKATELPTDKADKAAEVSDKAKQASDKTKAVQPGTGIKQFFTNLAAGLKAMGTKEVLFGAVNTMVAAPALVIMAPGALAAMLIGKVDGKAVQNGLKGIAKGVAEFGQGKVFAGALAMILAAPALVIMAPGALAAMVIGKVDGKAVEKGLKGIANGVAEFGQGKVFAGALAMILATPGLIALSIAAIPLLIVGAGGKLIQTGLQGIASGISYMGDPKVFKGILGLALIGVALIPFAYAMSLIAGLDIDSVIAAAAGLVIFSAAVFGLGAIFMAGGGIIFGVGLLGLIGLGIALSVLGEGLQKVSSPMQVFSDAFSSFLKSVDPGSLILTGIGIGILGAGMAAFGVGAVIAVPGILAFAAAMKFAGPTIVQLASAIGDMLIQAMEKLPAIIDSIVNGFTTIFNTLAQNYQILIPVGIGLGTMAIGLAALGAAAFVALPGLVVLSFMLPLIASGAQQLAVGMQGVVSSLTTLSNLKADNFNAIGNGLLKIAKGLGAVALSGLAAVPVLAALSALGMASPPTAEMPKAAESKSAAPAVKATQPAPASIPPPATNAGATTQTQQTTETKSTKDSSGDISILVDKMTELIGVIKAGGTINVDGRKLANIVMANIKSTKFTD